MSEIILNGLTRDDLREIILESLSRAIKEVNPVKNESSNTDEFATRMEVAKLLKITLPTLHDWTKQGIITSYKIGKRVLYKRDEVKDSMHQRNFSKFKKEGQNA